jgi:biofilm protein TabA
MFCAHLEDEAAWRVVLRRPVWQASLEWLRAHAARAALGDYPLGEPGWFVNVHMYATQPEPQCVWESHERTVDVQYVIDGEEGIRWLPTRLLGQPVRRLEERDRLEWPAPAVPATRLDLRSGMFAVFVPGEGHCPMIALESPLEIRKAVVKIPVHLLGSGA